jgi:hypothetical protein
MDSGTVGNVAYWLGAIILALEQILKGAPETRARLPRFIASERWNYAPLLLLIVAGIIWVARAYFGPISVPQSQTVAAAVASKSITDGQHWRRMSDVEKWQLSRRMKALNLPVTNFSIMRYPNPDSEDLADDLEQTLEAAGWKPSSPPTAPIGGKSLAKGLLIVAPPNISVSIESALSKAFQCDVGRKDWDAGAIQIELGNPPES